ncbi:MAG: Coenzyme F420 hydrogenase/dehydrogenase, beta subunit C-terminal domain [Methanotrichaceae archaeon]|nr:Coenzyme F420 hydrogenase/dehydrogenase, beta subunit C-terminal domain [Methanotrichaceae archaeon]
MTKLRLKIDETPIEIDDADTILKTAKDAGIRIPTLCYHPALEPYGACRLCSVEIEKNGRKRIVTACNYPVEDGLVVKTNSSKIVDIRKMILELLLARCPKEKRILELAEEYGVNEPRFRLEDEKCILCGLCARICEELVGVSAINVMNRGVEREIDAPYRVLSNDCIGCGSCALVCPTDAIKSSRNIYPTSSADVMDIEHRFLRGVQDEELGIYSELIAGKTSIAGQDGGMVTSMLIAGMKKNMFDAAIVVLQRKGYGAEAVITDNVDKIMAARGTKYVRTSIVSRLVEALKEGRKRIAMVGTPCQVRNVRKLQHHGYLDDEFPGTEITLLGLFCFESFDYRNLKAYTIKRFGVDLEDADKTQIIKGKYVVSLSGNDYSCSVRDLKNEVREGCDFCNDFVSRLADVSIGSVGSPEGYSTVIVRSTIV